MSTDTSPLRLSAHELLQAYGDRTLSPVEVATVALDAIDAHNSRLRHFLATNREDALRAARRAEQAWSAGEPTGMLCGVPVSVKDGTEMEGMPTTYGSVAFVDNYQPDAVLVTRLREAGAVILGKTNLPEFALSAETYNKLGEPARNPWDNERGTGGSSGGAGGAVAAGLGPIAMGTDSGGSIRCPAAYNGVYGIKPTYQRIPAVQNWRAAPGRSHNGPLTRTVADSALLLEAIAGPHAGDPESQIGAADWSAWDEPIDLRGRRVALVPSLSDAQFGGEIAEIRTRAGELAAAHGADVFEADSMPVWEMHRVGDGLSPYSADHYSAAESLRPNFLERHGSDLTDFIRPIYDGGRTVLAWQYRNALRHDQAFRLRMHAWFAEHSIDFVIMQSTGVAPKVHDVEGGLAPRSLRDLVTFNMARNPAASIPFGFDRATGLPVAVQVIGRLGDDVGVLQMSRLFEIERPWAQHWPPQGVFAA
jgi:aspartyl-tRNA(Asn)/glutamyl-tRNA(Gln) amidotransferase subunit A